MKLCLVEADISSNSYKKLRSRLNKYNREELLKIFDNYLCHELTDTSVEDLLSILDDLESSGTPITASVLEEILADASIFQEDDDEGNFEDPLRMILVTEPPSVEELEASKNLVDIIFDENYFENYVQDNMRSAVASTIIKFCEERDIPINPLWKDYLE